MTDVPSHLGSDEVVNECTGVHNCGQMNVRNNQVPRTNLSGDLGRQPIKFNCLREYHRNQ